MIAFSMLEAWSTESANLLRLWDHTNWADAEARALTREQGHNVCQQIMSAQGFYVQRKRLSDVLKQMSLMVADGLPVLGVGKLIITFLPMVHFSLQCFTSI